MTLSRHIRIITIENKLTSKGTRDPKLCVCVCLFLSTPVTELHAGTVPFFVLVEMHGKFLAMLTERDSSVHSAAFHQEMCHQLRTTHNPFPQISSASY